MLGLLHVDGEIAMVLILATTMGVPMFVAMCPVAGWTMVVVGLLLALTSWAPISGTIVTMLVLLWRLWFSMPSSEEVWTANKRPRSRLLVVLGSGGHTTEMFYDLATVDDFRHKFDATYITADTDAKSQAPANTFENDVRGRDATVCTIPRAREVGQSFASSVFPTLRATLSALKVILSVWPDAVVCNGPGTCVPVILAAYVPRFFCWKRIAVIYSESFACVDQVSLSGNIIYQMADVFTVQWDPLYRHCSSRFKYGHLLHGGRCRDGEKFVALPLEAQKGDDSAVVTVGSTEFDDLIRAIDTEDFIKALAALGITRLKVQKGNGFYKPSVLTGDAAKEAGIEVEVITYSPTLPEDLRGASLVVSHAGAGTVLDCLNHSRRMLIVPNEQLMDNHQAQLCKELKKYGLVRWCSCADISSTLEGYTGTELRKFPEKPTPTFASTVRQLCGQPNKEEEEEGRRRNRAHHDRYGSDRYDRY